MIETWTTRPLDQRSGQMVRDRAERRFEGKVVFDTRDDATGDVEIDCQPRTKARDEFF